MTNILKLTSLGFLLSLGTIIVSCDKDDPENNGPSDKTISVTIGFKDAPANLFGNSEYGDNLYTGEISTGYITKIYDDTYAQFPINYGYNYNSAFELTWCYSLYNGGFALSHYHNMEGDSYLNQLSVYDPSSPSGGNFIVATGYSAQTDPSTAVFSDYEGCAKVYLTDQKGYSVKNIGDATQVFGDDEDGWFKSVYINNTTYTYLSMLNGNAYSSALNAENKGWFKVQFIAFDEADAKGKPIGYTEVYLANFNKDLADGYEGIIDEWIEVDLSMLPECSVLVVNFVGSDTGDWGLNTPAFCALDNFVIEVEKD